MNKLYLPVVVFACIAGSCMAILSNKSLQGSHKYLGAAVTIGGEDEANARYNYELMQLRDPATGRIPDHIREKELAFAATLPNDGGATLSYLGKTTSVSWQARGPWNVGGRTRALAVDVSNENNLIAGSCSGGMWRSTDQGQSWVTTTPLTTYQSVSCVAQDTRAGHTNVWYYGTGEGYGTSASATGAFYLGNGIYKSIDGGATWTILSATTSANLVGFDKWGDIVWNVVANPAITTQDVVYAAAYGGIYKSLDGGTTWTLMIGTSISALSVSYFTDVAVSQTGVIYVSLSSDGSTKGLYRSTDGITFANITPAGFPTTYNRVKIGISPSDENQVYFLGNTPGFGTPDTNFLGDVEWNSMWKYKYLSGDGTGAGGNWRNLSVNLPSGGGLFDKFTCQGSYDLVVKVKPNDTNTVFIGGTNLYRSTTGFSDSTHTTFIGGYKQGATLPIVDMYINHHPDQHELVFLPSNPNKMISTNDGGIFKTNDNTASTVAWTSLNNGYLTTMFYACAIDHATTSNIIIGGAQDNGSWYTNSTNLTTPWVTPRGGDGAFCAIADNQAAYYFSIQNGKMMKAKLSAAGAVDSFARIDPIGGAGYLFVNPYTLDPNNSNIMYLAGGKYLWRNNDLSGIPYASNWDSISTNWVKFPDSVATAGAVITAIAVSKTPANRVYFGTSSQKVYRIDNANSGTPTPVNITSTTGGANFPAQANVSCIAVDPTNADHVMVVFSNYSVYSIFYSADGGTTWAKAGGNLETNASGTGNGPSCRWASIIPVSNGTVYLVGTSVGLFATRHLSGTSTVWVQQGTESMGSSVVNMMDYRSNDGLVVAATHSHGIFSTHITDTLDVRGDGDTLIVTGVTKQLSTNFDVHLAIFPNPFTTQATVRFDLNKESNVSIQLLDEMGKQVMSIANEHMYPGEKSYKVNSGNLPAGVYYCTLTLGTMHETKRLVLVR
ncbi:MAG: T9SS type A sorting domain-containing protein [Bacteroidota bacterium]